jgi:hypothetical protein
VITVGEDQCVLPARCVNCCVNRVGCGTAMKTELTPHISKRKIKKLATQKELEIMNGIGGNRQPASGACAGHKSDGRLYGRVRMESKFTTKKSFVIKRKELDKIRGECQEFEKPVFIIDFTDAAGKTEDRWAVIPHKEWERTINEIDDNR